MYYINVTTKLFSVQSTTAAGQGIMKEVSADFVAFLGFMVNIMNVVKVTITTLMLQLFTLPTSRTYSRAKYTLRT